MKCQFHLAQYIYTCQKSSNTRIAQCDRFLPGAVRPWPCIFNGQFYCEHIFGGEEKVKASMKGSEYIDLKGDGNEKLWN